jgi:ribonucleoside-diphosphate reductase alpha chain
MLDNQPFPQPISEQIWNDKYRLTTPNKAIADDLSVYDTWKRIAKACADADIQIYPGASGVPDPFASDARYHYFLDALEGFKFLPAGRITAGAGTGRNVTLFNCYVMGTIPDSMAGIFDMLKEAALTMQQGGGIGYDFSPLRPKDSPVKGVDADASGPLTFMDVWDSMCRTVMSAGSRRGAMMATMSCDHPDVEAFIQAKKDPLRLRMFNLSVLISNRFMKARENDDEWPLMHKTPPTTPVMWNNVTQIEGKHIYKVVKARELWNTIMKATYDQAEPGVIFIDRINYMNNLHYMETISATNPCGEQPLPPYGACLLGSINLAKMVINPFTSSATINWNQIKETAKAATMMLDAVIDISNFPLEAQKAEAKFKRRMGIGITGLADMLFMLGHTYGTEMAAETAENIMYAINLAAYTQSVWLARDYGPCPATETKEQRKAFIQSGFMRNMPAELKDQVLKHGIRNTHLTSIAPTGTISLYAGNVSSGGEPIFAPKYTRKVLEKDGSRREEQVEDYAVRLHREYCENNSLDVNPNPEHLVTAQTLDPMSHLRMQAALQKWVDSSISKTINLPEDISFEEFKKVYVDAYNMGCKGCTTYRPNAITGSVISVETKAEEPKESPVAEFKMPVPDLSKRPEIMMGATYKIKAGSDHAMYVSMTYTETNGIKAPYEVFVNSKNMEHFAWTVALTRMISAIFRRGGDVSFVVEELKAVFDPRGGSWIKGKYVPSDAAAIGAVIEQFMKDISYMSDSTVIVETKPASIPVMMPSTGNGSISAPNLCIKCFGSNFKKEAGCEVCNDCGHSKCG